VKLFRNHILFSVVFFFLLILDVVVKNLSDEVIQRLLTKMSLIALLLVFYLINNKEILRKNKYALVMALIFFMSGDLFFIFDKNPICFSLGILFFILGKLAYALRFTNNQDFSFKQLLPPLFILFSYMTFLMVLIQASLGDYFIPVLVYLFTSLIVCQFAYLRINTVSKKSFFLVLIGVFFSILSDSVSVLQAFYDENFGYHEITIMLFYGISQYLIIMGIVSEEHTALSKRK